MPVLNIENNPMIRGRLTDYRADLDIAKMSLQTMLLFAIDDVTKVLPFADFAVDDVSVLIDIVPNQNLRNTYQRIQGTLRRSNECAQFELTDTPEGFSANSSANYFLKPDQQKVRGCITAASTSTLATFRCNSRVCNGRICFGQCRLDKDCDQ